jgi:hypothetical protein
VAILLVSIGAYSINGYWWIFYIGYWWLLTVFILVVIGSYFINGY